MIKYIRLFFVVLTFIDVAVFPSACSTNNNYKSNVGEVYLKFVDPSIKSDDDPSYNYITARISETLFVGDIVTENAIKETVQSNIECDFEITAVSIVNHNSDVEKNYIELPYTIKESDPLTYYQGIREPVILLVELKEVK